MKAIRVEYQVSPDFVEQNKANIQKVMSSLQEYSSERFFYSVYYLGDGKFMHHSITAENDFLKITEHPDFKAFQKALMASNPVTKPQSTNLELVGWSRNIF